jgi:alkanesulfonate monooxygenase SsuD/methylene tetrahydromethanopterin reductase-like flavin-dependent oxidoreductase (luciferase family)
MAEKARSTSDTRAFGVAAGLDSDVAREVAARCAELGYRSLWSNDHPMASGIDTAADFAGAAPDLEVGVAVLALDRHPPEEIAASVGASGIAPDRLWIGIGAGFSKRPLGVVREGLAAARSALPSGTRIAVAAMGPKMCALAGAEADGVFLNWMTPEKAAWARERVHEGAAEAGRDRPPVIFGYVRVAVGDDAQERLLKEESFYRQLHAGYIKHFESLGREPGTVGVAAADPVTVQAELERYRPAIDHLVIRALAHADVSSLAAVAEAAAPSKTPA